MRVYRIWCRRFGHYLFVGGQTIWISKALAECVQPEDTEIHEFELVKTDRTY